MTRGSFLRSLFVAAASPKVLASINFEVAAKPLLAPTTHAAISKCLISDLQLLTPDYYTKMLEKYGNADFTTMIEYLGQNNITHL